MSRVHSSEKKYLIENLGFSLFTFLIHILSAGILRLNVFTLPLMPINAHCPALSNASTLDVDRSKPEWLTGSYDLKWQAKYFCSDWNTSARKWILCALPSHIHDTYDLFSLSSDIMKPVKETYLLVCPSNVLNDHV